MSLPLHRIAQRHQRQTKQQDSYHDHERRCQVDKYGYRQQSRQRKRRDDGRCESTDKVRALLSKVSQQVLKLSTSLAVLRGPVGAQSTPLSNPSGCR